MSIKYKKYQLKNKESKFDGKWYGRAVMTDVIDTDALAEIIQRNCTVKRSDVKAVLTELSEVMKDELLSSHRVKIDGLGSFKVGLKTKPADTAKKFTASENVAGVRLLFSAEWTVNADKTRTRTLLNGVKVAEMQEYSVTDTTADTGE